MYTPKGSVSISSSAITAYLALIADSGWVSKRALNLWLTAPNWRSKVIRKMQDKGYITCNNLNEKVKGKKRRRRKKMREDKNIAELEEDVPPYIYGTRYALLKAGREYLREFNPRKYGNVVDITAGTNNYDIRKVFRASLLSEMRAMSELAGYSVHGHAKPYVAVLSTHPISLADRPAFTAAEIPERFVGVENSYFNQGTFQYYEQGSIRKAYGYEHFDAKRYSYRETPIGCVYTPSELLALAKSETEYIGGNKEEHDKMRYVRTSGVFFSGHGAYRLYNTERTAPRLRVSGESNMEIFINAWCANVYKRSLTDMADDGTGNPEFKFIVPELRGNLLFGDATHTAAISVLKQSNRSNFGGKINENEREYRNYNLRHMPDTYFIPVIQEAIPLYSMMIYPHWPYWIKKMGKDYLGTLNAEQSEAPSIMRSYIGESFPHGNLDDGSALLILISLHLDTVHEMVDEILDGETEFTVLAMEWQKPFFDALIEELDPEVIHKLKVIYIPQGYLNEYAKLLHEEQENPYYAKPECDDNN